jgi:glycine cleavage system H protein
MNPKDLAYTDQHEWIRVAGGVGTVGITDHAQQALGDVTFVELPPVGAVLARGDEACAIESAKAAASIFAPVGGAVVEVNSALNDDPGLVNAEPYGAGWIYKLQLADAAEVAALKTSDQYDKFLTEEPH